MSYTPPAQSVVSTVNSTTAVLGVSAVFTGTSENVTQYASVTVLVFANQASATDGLSIQQSPDGTNWDNFDAYSIPASTGKSFAVQITGQFFRVVYTNGVTANTVFRLQTIYHYYATPTSSVRPQDARTNDNDMQETVAYVAGFNGTTWDRLRTALTGILNISLGYVNGIALLTGNGTTGTGSPRVTIASDNAQNSNAWKVVTAATGTSSGLLPAKINAAASTNATSVKASTGTIYGWALTNTTAINQVVRIYNLAVAPTVGTSVPIYNIVLPPNGGMVMPKSDPNIPFSTGFSYAITTGLTDLDATATTANSVVGTIFYV